MNKAFLVLTLVLIASMTIASAVDYIPQAEAKKSVGHPNTKFGSATKRIVCGDKMCSDSNAQKPTIESSVGQHPKTGSCQNNTIMTDSGCSSYSVTGAKITKSYHHSSTGTTTILVDSQNDGKITINASLKDMMVFVDGEEWDEVIVDTKKTTIEFFAGTEKIELVSTN